MTAWAAQALLGSALVMAFVLGARGAFVYFGGARAAYALWALVPLRFLLPPLPAPVPEGAVTVSIELVAAAAGPAQPIALASWLLPLWLAGAAFAVCWQALAYRCFVRRALAAATPLGAVAGIPVLQTPVVAGPVAIGLIARRILVPSAFNAQPEAERALALEHEALHHRRGDLWANLLACGLLALHWFNPIAWAAHRAFRRDQELACDAAVIGAASPETRLDYGRALARAAGALPPSPATTLGEAKTLKRRLSMLKAHRARTSGLAKIGTAALGLAALGLTATSGAAQTADTDKVIVKVVERRGDKQLTDAERQSIVDRETGERCAQDARRTETTTQTVRDGKPVTTRLIVCSDQAKALNPAQLEKLRDGLSKLENVSPDHRAAITAAMDAAIAQARAGR